MDVMFSVKSFQTDRAYWPPRTSKGMCKCKELVKHGKIKLAFTAIIVKP